MYDHPFHSIIHLYLDACFAEFDVGALERAELDQLARWNRGLAASMLMAGSAMLLPLWALAIAASVFWGTGEALLLGWPVFIVFGAALVGLMVGQVLLVGLLVLLCTLCMEWEPLGFVLALADMLHTTPRVLQNIWRFMVISPLVPMIILLIYP